MDFDIAGMIRPWAIRIGLLILALGLLQGYGAYCYYDGVKAERQAWTLKMTEEKARAAGIRRAIEAEGRAKVRALDDLRENLTAAQRTAMEAALAAEPPTSPDAPRPRVVLPRSVVRAIGEVH